MSKRTAAERAPKWMVSMTIATLTAWANDPTNIDSKRLSLALALLNEKIAFRASVALAEAA